MTSFAPREAMTTAEPPEPLIFSAFRIHFIQNKSFSELTARWRGFCLFRVFSGLITDIRVHSCPFVVSVKVYSMVSF